MTWIWRAALVAMMSASAATVVAQSSLPSVALAKEGQSAIRGTVVNAQTNAPVADAKVTLVEVNLTVKTSQDGRFEFAQIAPRTYTLTVSTIGYIFVRRQVDAPRTASSTSPCRWQKAPGRIRKP
jgi:hypothetical protein